MATKFGKTWWGNEWLRSLTSIDYQNRIPRGAAYARQGAVMETKISAGRITARVRGTRTYNVEISVPLFSKSETDALIEGILAHPVVVAELLNRKLSPTVMKIAEKKKLRVFPSTWHDLGMRCSCPDWAVPCKHIAAVIYKVGQEIDNNPFLVFELHGVDIIGELKKRGVLIDTKKETEVPDWNEAMQLAPRQEETLARPNTQELPTFNFSKIATLGEAILRLLPASPPFYGGKDFMAAYQRNMGRVAKATQAILDGKRTGFEAMQTWDHYGPTSQLFNIKIKVNGKHNATTFFFGDDEGKSLTRLMQALMGIPPERLAECNDTVYALKALCLLTLHTAARGNIVPMITKCKVKGQSGNQFEIVWTPYMADAQTAEIIQKVNTLLPADIIEITNNGRTNLGPNDPAWFVTTLFLTEIVRLASQHYDLDQAYRLFFDGGLFGFDKAGETAIPGAIKSWTDHLRAPQMRYTPVIMVRDAANDGSEFLLEMGICDTQGDGTTVEMRRVFTDEEFANSRYTILREASMLASLVYGVEPYLANEAKKPINMSNAKFVEFLTQTAPAMRLLGIRLLLPKSLREIVRPKPSIAISARPADSKAFLRIDQLLQFNWKVAIGNELISPDEFKRLVSNAQGLIRFKQQYFYVSEADLKKIEKAFASHTEMTPGRMLQSALAADYKSANVSISPEVKELIKQWTTLKEVDVPAGIHATLRPYQKRGYEWMLQNMQLGFGSILADDMGLGKTLQVITLLQKLKDDGKLEKKHVLVVAPTGLLANWEAELHRFAPGLSTFIYHGTNRCIEDFNHDIMLTSYSLVRLDINAIKKMKWVAVVIDEAQNIKNASAAQSKAVKAVKADTHIALSGTPVENRLAEYWSIMDFANKGYLGTLKSFNEEYAKPIQENGDTECAEKFRRITAPMMMRRLKTDKSIINDLPDKIEQDEFAMLTPAQAAIYEQVLNESMKTIEGIDENDNKLLFKRQGLILQMILALKQICNHPAQYLKNGDFRPELSGKAEMLIDLANSIADSGEKALIFTQFTEMGEMLKQFVGQATGRTPMFLHGGCPIKQRKEMVDRFQNDRAERFFILSLKAAGTGLNLTAATHVIHYDLWWNPAVEAQATDRAYRIGQHKNVMVHRFITGNTFEERINDMINTKRKLADMTVSAGESWIGKLSNKELRDIFG